MRCKDWSFTDQQFTDSHERSTNRYVRRHDLNLDLILFQLQKQLLSKFETLVLWRVHEMDWTQKLKSGWLLESKIRGYKCRDTMPYAATISHDFHKWRDPTLYQSCTVRNSNHRGSANVQLYTKEWREKKFYYHARAWGYSGIRTSKKRLSLSNAAVQSRSRSYVLLYQELSIDTGQTILQQQSLLQRRNCLQSS
jgi:hypothetical protein